MTHDDAREMLEVLALDALDASERDAVLAHVTGCATCRAELAELERTAAQLSYAVAPLPMSAAQRDRVRSRLLARAGAGRTAVSSHGSADVLPLRPATTAPARRRLAGSGWLAMAASVIAVLSIGALMQARSERDSLRESVRVASAERAARAAALDSLRVALVDRDRMIANLTGQEVAVMTLAASSPQAPSARMFWDQAHDAWIFVAHNLGAPKQGRTYQLWLVTPTAKISAGTFTPRANGEAVVRATYALPRNSLAAVAVTDEPSGGSAQPTTEPFMVAAKSER